MPDQTKNDVAVLQGYLGDSGGLAYVDFQESEAIRSALQRWPLLRRLMPQPGTTADQGATDVSAPMRRRDHAQG